MPPTSRNLLRTFSVTALLCAALASPVGAQGLPAATPESVGLSGERLHRLSDAMQRAVDEQTIAGAVTLVARRGKVVQFEAYGKLDREKNIPMTKDAIFRIASMSKPITTVAVMMLVEEGRLLLTDPVSKFIPTFKQTTVMEAAGPVPARRPITIRHLLTHTAGISYGTGALEAQYKEKDLYYWYFADNDEPIGVSIERLGSLQFEAHPGERWVYGFATDVLGAVVEKVSGMPLDEFLRTRIFAPLKMNDTHFYLPPDKAARLATVYSGGGDGLVRAPDEGRGQGNYVEGPRKSFSGGAGLLSTASDYSRFLQMLLNGGELDGVRLLGPKTVDLMTSNHVGNLYSDGRLGFGLGFEIVEHVGRAGRPGSVGEYGWGGAYYTTMWVDPVESLVVVFMSQLLPIGSATAQAQLRSLVYQAVIQSDASR
jgi:CubicO group peptidase (beta-lactamase class C family)